MVGLALLRPSELERGPRLVNAQVSALDQAILGSTVRAVVIAVVSCVVIVVLGTIRPDAYSWQPWIAAEVFTLTLGRTLFRQRSLISQLEAAREALADQAVADERRRIAREALANIARHARQNRVVLTASTNPDGDTVVLRVTDHGHQAARLDPQSTLFGLLGMSERARSLGGKVIAEPTVDGWQVEATLPLNGPSVNGSQP